MKRFLPSDDRFIIFILKRNRFNFVDKEFVLSVRYYTLIAVSNLVRRKQEFESEAMLVNWLGKCIVNAAKRSLTHMNTEKGRFYGALNSIEGKGEDLSGEEYISLMGQHDEQEQAEQSDVDIFINHIENKYGYEYSFYIRERIKGMLQHEIGECIGRTPRQVSKMASKIRKEYVRHIRREETRTSETASEFVRDNEREQVEREKQEERDTLREIRSFIHSF